MTKLQIMKQKFEAAVMLHLPDIDPMVFEDFKDNKYPERLVNFMWIGYNMGIIQR